MAEMMVASRVGYWAVRLVGRMVDMMVEWLAANLVDYLVAWSVV